AVRHWPHPRRGCGTRSMLGQLANPPAAAADQRAALAPGEEATATPRAAGREQGRAEGAGGLVSAPGGDRAGLGTAVHHLGHLLGGGGGHQRPQPGDASPGHAGAARVAGRADSEEPLRAL
ncbi:unnamed protein product, partial [Effrenium voratum]